MVLQAKREGADCVIGVGDTFGQAHLDDCIEKLKVSVIIPRFTNNTRHLRACVFDQSILCLLVQTHLSFVALVCVSSWKSWRKRRKCC